MSRARIALLAAPFAAAALACAPAESPSVDSADDDSPVVARIGDTDVTRSQLDEWIRDQLFDQQVTSKSSNEQYELRSRALEEYLTDRALALDAESRNLSQEEVLAQAVAELGPVSDEEVSAFFEEHKERFRPPNNTLEIRGPQIRQFLQSDRQRQARDDIRTRADVEVLLEPPRFEIAATGPSRGPEGAPVTVVEFSDFQCPYCVRAEPVIDEVLRRYPDQVRLVYRHLPLDSIHPQARPAAEASICAAEQDRFWEFHAALFANQRALTEEDLVKYATELGLDLDAFAACRARPDVKRQVQADVEAAQAAGVTGTPAFFVNGVLLTGAKPVEDFVRVIDAELDRLGAETEAGAS